MDYTTKITTLFDEDSQRLMSDTIYPVYSCGLPSILTQSEVEELLQVFFKLQLNRYFDCIQKAKIVAAYLGITKIHLGSLMIESIEDGTSYGYLYNPPLELHAWVQDGLKIIDFALAGAIEKGLMTKDSFGPFLIGRQPVVLAGMPADWMKYVTKEIVVLEKINILDIDTAKQLLKNSIVWKR